MQPSYKQRLPFLYTRGGKHAPTASTATCFNGKPDDLSPTLAVQRLRRSHVTPLPAQEPMAPTSTFSQSCDYYAAITMLNLDPGPIKAGIQPDLQLLLVCTCVDSACHRHPESAHGSAEHLYLHSEPFGCVFVTRYRGGKTISATYPHTVHSPFWTQLSSLPV